MVLDELYKAVKEYFDDEPMPFEYPMLPTTPNSFTFTGIGIEVTTEGSKLVYHYHEPDFAWDSWEFDA